ncbi:hypothetical protein HDU89_007392 [Geranomyces variabilis]|nr:hypothetical protein HDU89_007392 [Geranomyces variabilis]
MDNDAALGPFSLLPPTYQAQLRAALLSQVDDVATSEARYHPASSASAAATVWTDLSTLGAHRELPAETPTSRNHRSLYASLCDACLKADAALGGYKDPNDLFCSASSVLLEAMAATYALNNKSQALIHLSSLFFRHCHGNPNVVAGLRRVRRALEKVCPYLTSTGWMSNTEQQALLVLLASIDARCRSLISTFRTSFPGDEPEGELDNAISLLRIVMKMPLFHQILGQEDAPTVSFRETINILLVDGTRSRYQALCGVGTHTRYEELRAANLAPRDGDNVDVATEAVKLVKMVFTDIQFDARYFEKEFRSYVRITRVTAPVYLEQLVESLNVLTAGAGASVNTTKLARLRELVDETYIARPWETGHWNDGQQIREYFEHKFAEFLCSDFE